MDDQCYPFSEIRFFKTGWIIRFGIFAIRWNKQEGYSSLSFEHLKSNFKFAGGMTWKQFRLSQKQKRKVNEVQEC